MNFFRTFSEDMHEIGFSGLSLVEKKRVLQALYDKGYSVKAISSKLNISQSCVRSKIDAHRGRGPM